MEFKESTRRYILLGIVAFIVIALIAAKVLANNQNKQFSLEHNLYDQALQLSNREDYEQAAIYINELLKYQPNSQDANYLGALIAGNTGELKQAGIRLQKTLDINPYKAEDAIFMLQFGEILYQLERYNDAKVVLSRCKENGWVPDTYPGYQERVQELLNSIENTK